jgi:hypothetical protein
MTALPAANKRADDRSVNWNVYCTHNLRVETSHNDNTSRTHLCSVMSRDVTALPLANEFERSAERVINARSTGSRCVAHHSTYRGAYRPRENRFAGHN